MQDFFFFRFADATVVRGFVFPTDKEIRTDIFITVVAGGTIMEIHVVKSITYVYEQRIAQVHFLKKPPFLNVKVYVIFIGMLFAVF